MSAEYRHQQFTTSRAHQSRNPEDFTFASSETYVVDEKLAWNRRIFDRDVADLKDDVTAVVLDLRKNLVDFAADHLRNHAALIQIARRVRTDCAPVAQHRNAIADMEDFVELVRNINHRYTARAQIIQNAEQRPNFGLSKRCGWFIEHQNARFLR